VVQNIFAEQVRVRLSSRARESVYGVSPPRAAETCRSAATGACHTAGVRARVAARALRSAGSDARVGGSRMFSMQSLGAWAVAGALMYVTTPRQAKELSKKEVEDENKSRQGSGPAICARVRAWPPACGVSAPRAETP